MPRPASTGLASVNGIRMHYQIFGEGEPLLLIHGGLGHADHWAFQVPDLAKTHRVIVADSRGRGRSTRTEAPFSPELMAADYLALLDQLSIERTALVGWSDGANIGLAIAMTWPERLTKLFAHAGNATSEGVDPAAMTNAVFGAYVARCGEDYRRLSPTPEQYELFVEQIGRMWYSLPNWTASALARIVVPTAIVLGDHDEAITRTHSEYLAATIPGAKLVSLEATSHFSMFQDPDGYTRAIRDVLAD
jgi:pimeloyl-ACP methyl ester carboxylesterase